MLDPEERRRHLYIVGQTGTGKSTLLLNLIRQDLAAGEGLALLDPHGDLAEAALASRSARRAPTISSTSIRPTRSGRSASIPSRACRTTSSPSSPTASSSAFRHVWPDSWGPRLDYILTNAVRALLDVPGATLLMLPRLLIDEPFRAQLVEHHVARSGRARVLAERVSRATATASAPRPSPRSRTRSARRSWCRACATCWRSRKARSRCAASWTRARSSSAISSKGALGESTAHLLGALLTTAIAQAALSRADTPRGRAPRLPSLCRRVPILRHRELRAHSLRGAQVRPDAHHRAPVPRPAPRPASRPPCSAMSDRSSPAAPAPRTPRSSPSRSAWAVPTLCSIFRTSPPGRGCCAAACRPPRSGSTSSMRRPSAGKTCTG